MRSNIKTIYDMEVTKKNNIQYESNKKKIRYGSNKKTIYDMEVTKKTIYDMDNIQYESNVYCFFCGSNVKNNIQYAK